MCVRKCACVFVCVYEATHPLMGHLTKLPICSSAQFIPLLMLLLTLHPLPILPFCLLLVLHSIILSKYPILLIPWQSHHFPSSRSPLLAELTSSPLLSFSPPSGVHLQPLLAVLFHPHPKKSVSIRPACKGTARFEMHRERASETQKEKENVRKKKRR